jgi:hypothetical protein
LLGVPHPDSPVARGHLRIATAPVARPRAERRLLLLLRALATTVALAWLTLVAWSSAAVALAPLLWRRAPLGRRVHPMPPRQARIIPFQPRRQALPR